MVKFGCSISTEQLGPSEIINTARQAEELGFDFVLMSDHYHPWLDSQGQSAFAWTILGSIAQVTNKIQVGTAVTAPILRYHPAILAQAVATASVLMPDRFIFGIGTGENLNEHVVGQGWPPYHVRKEMFIEAIEIMKLLWQGGYQNYSGEYFIIESARIYTLPEKIPPIILSAFGPKSAELAGVMGDGLISTSPQANIVKIFEQNGGKDKPKYAQMTVCYHEDEQVAKQIAYEMWGFTALPAPMNTELKTPAFFQKAMKMITPDDVAKEIICGPKLDKYVEQIHKYIKAGFDHIYLNQVGHEQEHFMKFYKEKIIPAVAAYK